MINDYRKLSVVIRLLSGSVVRLAISAVFGVLFLFVLQNDVLAGLIGVKAAGQRAGCKVVGAGDPEVITLPSSGDTINYDVNLECLTKSGRVRWSKYNGFRAGVAASNKYVVYGNAETVLAIWQPGDNTLSYIRQHWRVYCVSERTGHQIWDRSLIDVGTPLAIYGHYLWTDVQSNVTEYYGRGGRPIYGIGEYDMTTGRIISWWQFPYLRDLYWQAGPNVTGGVYDLVGFEVGDRKINLTLSPSTYQDGLPNSPPETRRLTFTYFVNDRTYRSCFDGRRICLKHVSNLR